MICTEKLVIRMKKHVIMKTHTTGKPGFTIVGSGATKLWRPILVATNSGYGSSLPFSPEPFVFLFAV
jgi:hypothetical protein